VPRDSNNWLHLEFSSVVAANYIIQNYISLKQKGISQMGQTVQAKCRECRKVFYVDYGGGFYYHLVHCEKCGEKKQIGFVELGELHLRYLKGLSMPFCIASTEHDQYVREHVQVEPITEDEYHKGVESIAGTCGCGGNYSLNAPPRCPKCHSTQFYETGRGDIIWND
jgi:Zn finger protein HypA/HybF involved in hydrogenase expression